MTVKISNARLILPDEIRSNCNLYFENGLITAITAENLPFDELIDAKLAELVKNPEYIRDVKAASGDLDKMMEVFERYSGIKISWVELKQFGFRQAGVY